MEFEKKIERELSTKITTAEKVEYEEFKQIPNMNMPETKSLQFYKNGKFKLIDIESLEKKLSSNSILLKETLVGNKNTSNGTLLCYFNTENKFNDEKARHRTFSNEDNFGIVNDEKRFQDYINHSLVYPNNNLRENDCIKRSLSASRISLSNNLTENAFKEFELFYKKRLEVETIL